FAGRPHRLQEAVCGEIAAHFAHLVAEHRVVFDPMPVAIDDRMVDFRTDLLRGHMGGHDLLRKVAAQHVDFAASARAAPPPIAAEPCTERKATTHLRRVSVSDLSDTVDEAVPAAVRPVCGAAAPDCEAVAALPASLGIRICCCLCWA